MNDTIQCLFSFSIGVAFHRGEFLFGETQGVQGDKEIGERPVHHEEKLIYLLVGKCPR